MSPRLLAFTATACALGALGAATTASAHSGHASRTARHSVFSAWDEEWLMTSIQGDRFEIAGGQIARSHSGNAQIKALGTTLVTDHTKSLKSAVRLARRLGIKVPKTPSPSQMWELKVVGRMTGTAFDKNYADLEVLDHKQDIKETKDEVQLGTNRVARKEARTDLPTLRKHLRLARAALAAVGGNG